MTKNIISAYRSLSPPRRRILTLAVLLLVVLSSVVVAVAAGGVSFSGQTPANGSVVATAKPQIAVNATANETLTDSSIQMFIDKRQVTPVVAPGAAAGQYTVSYTPGDVLSSGSHTVLVSVYEAAYAGSTSTSWSFTVDAAPKVLSVAPADGAVLEAANPKITAGIRDTYDNLNAAGVTLKIDGTAVPAGFAFKGYDSYDTCSGEYLGYIITSYKEGTVNYQANGLTDGIHTAEINMADVKGNVMTKQWSFKVATKPAFSGFIPANGAAGKSFSGLSLKVSDVNNNLNPDSIILKIDNRQVIGTYNATVGTVVYNGSFGYGNHAVTVSAADTAGNTGTAGWSFIVDTRPPDIKVDPMVIQTTPYYKTAPFGTVAITDGQLKFRAVLSDLVDISGTGSTPGVVVKLDGQPLAASVMYEMNYDSCTGEVLGVKSRKTVNVNYEGVIADGNHTLTMTRGDILGNTATETWNLIVESKPVITKWSPATYITDFKPVISANIKDGNSTLDPGAITMSLDGQRVTPAYDPVTGNLTYVPDRQLANEAYHTVALSAYDQGGLGSGLAWKLYINTYPDMDDANINNCTSCHTYAESPYYNGPYELIHAKKLSFGGTHSSNNCNLCHNYITQPDQCGQCHSFDTEIADGSGPHGTSMNISYSTKSADPYTPVRITRNREMWDCVICHQPGSGTMKRQTLGVNKWIPQNNHDIPELHKAPASSCSECHALSLTREHARNGRVDANGLPVNCSTCHKSTVTDIVYAIKNGNTNCSACHKQADHESIHVNGLDANCQTCHQAALTGEHLANATTAGRNFSCDTCHANTGKQEKRAIANNNLNCAGCHRQGHNILFADKVPANIPLYSSYQWTVPMEASLFAGEASVPVGYGDGQVVMSNRRSDVTAAEIWDFYNRELTAGGWTLKSGAPAAGAAWFTAEFVNDSRAVTVKSYNTDSADGVGQPNAAGYRLEIWYR